MIYADRDPSEALCKVCWSTYRKGDYYLHVRKQDHKWAVKRRAEKRNNCTHAVNSDCPHYS